MRIFFNHIFIGSLTGLSVSSLVLILYFVFKFDNMVPLGVFICQHCIVLGVDKGQGSDKSQILGIVIFVNLINSIIYSSVAGAIWVGRRNPAYAWLAPVTYFAIPLLFLVGVWVRLWG